MVWISGNDGKVFLIIMCQDHAGALLMISFNLPNVSGKLMMSSPFYGQVTADSEGLKACL